jgi:hypothetical protein
VATVFLSAGTTTCLDDRTAITSSTAKPTSKPAALPACPTTALVTSVANVTKTFSLTSCLVSAINCPASLTQVVVVTDVQRATTTLCPSSFNATNATAPTTTVAPVAFYTAGAITLPPLTSPVITSIAPALLANVTAPVNATIAGLAVTVPVLTTPPPETTALVNVGGKNDSRPATATSKAGGATARASVHGGFVGLLGVLVGAVVLL